MTIFFICFVVWALLHSLTAASTLKEFFRQRLGTRVADGLYRLAYNLFAIGTFLPVLYLAATQLPHTLLWAIPDPFRAAAFLVQGIGAVGLLVSLSQTDVWDFLGVRQALGLLTGEDASARPPELVTSGVYAFVRHPLYFFSLLVIWFTPTMTLNTLIFNVLVTLYFWIGAYYEERRLAAFFGEEYQNYQRSVPRLFPRRLIRR
ncbi:MAG: NnrU family protein [Anaerolineae bacterium]